MLQLPTINRIDPDTFPGSVSAYLQKENSYANSNLGILIEFTISYTPIGRLPMWRIGEYSPNIAGIGEIKYLDRTSIFDYLQEYI